LAFRKKAGPLRRWGELLISVITQSVVSYCNPIDNAKSALTNLVTDGR
jgi:hypothetical protein